MADVVYDLAVRLQLNFAGLASSTSTVVAMFRSIEKQANASSVAGAKLGLVMGGAITAGGVAGVVAMKSWVDAAAKMDLSLQTSGPDSDGDKCPVASPLRPVLPGRLANDVFSAPNPRYGAAHGEDGLP